ncbi:hypothetical protein BH09ACT6_BH09ACT6_22340 [soil metagenome]
MICPRCSNRAVVARRRVTCDSCGFADAAPVKVRADGVIESLRWPDCQTGLCVDQVFGLTFWLQTRCLGETLWAANQEHLDYLHDYLDSQFRPTEGLGTLLPKWTITRKHRPQVLRGIGRLQEMAERVRAN